MYVKKMMTWIIAVACTLYAGIVVAGLICGWAG